MEVYPNHVIVFLSATDDKSGLMNIKYKINNSAQKIYSEPISNLSPGRDYKIEVLATDKLGNMSNKEIEFSVN
jgi:REP element-mobilizing transposase RayT